MVFGGITDIAFAKQLKQDEQRNFNKKAEQNLDCLNQFLIYHFKSNSTLSNGKKENIKILFCTNLFCKLLLFNMSFSNFFDKIVEKKIIQKSTPY